MVPICIDTFLDPTVGSRVRAGLEAGMRCQWDGSEGKFDKVSGPKLFLQKVFRSMFQAIQKRDCFK